MEWLSSASLENLGLAAGGGGLGFALKTILDWTINRKKIAAEAEIQLKKTVSDAEEVVRNDLLEELHSQRQEVGDLRKELGEARKEIREFAQMHTRAISEWQDRYGQLLLEVAELRATVQRQANLP